VLHIVLVAEATVSVSVVTHFEPVRATTLFHSTVVTVVLQRMYSQDVELGWKSDVGVRDPWREPCHASELVLCGSVIQPPDGHAAVVFDMRPDEAHVSNAVACTARGSAHSHHPVVVDADTSCAHHCVTALCALSRACSYVYVDGAALEGSIPSCVTSSNQLR
jgi:hypothetical protein